MSWRVREWECGWGRLRDVQKCGWQGERDKERKEKKTEGRRQTDINSFRHMSYTDFAGCWGNRFPRSDTVKKKKRVWIFTLLKSAWNGTQKHFLPLTSWVQNGVQKIDNSFNINFAIANCVISIKIGVQKKRWSILDLRNVFK